MSDISNTPPPTLPSLPEPFQIPVQLVEQWTNLGQAERIAIELTRQDFDHLFFGLLRTVEAQGMLADVMVSWSNGDIDQANKQLHEFRRQNIDALNRVRQFITAIMVSKSRAPSHGQ